MILVVIPMKAYQGYLFDSNKEHTFNYEIMFSTIKINVIHVGVSFYCIIWAQVYTVTLVKWLII